MRYPLPTQDVALLQSSNSSGIFGHCWLFHDVCKRLTVCVEVRLQAFELVHQQVNGMVPRNPLPVSTQKFSIAPSTAADRMDWDHFAACRPA